MPKLEPQPYEDAFDEIELLGFPLCNPFLLLDSQYADNTTAQGMAQKLTQTVQITGYLVTIKYTRTKDGKTMYFATFYDHQGIVFDTTHFPQVAMRYPFKGKGFYRICGKVVDDFGYPMIEVTYMQKLPMVKNELALTA